MAEYIDKWSVVNRLIDIENEFQRHKPFHGFEHAMYRKICETEIAIGKTPAADVETVKHGRWLPQILLGTRVWDCSECKTIGSPQWKRCPVCEAKMDL